jgi:tRNA(Arg) A34 adenosine deaminase TadA
MKVEPVTVSLPDWMVSRLSSIRTLRDVRERMALAIELSRQNVEHGTGGPFGAVIVSTETGALLSAGVNLVEHQKNSALHAEMVAIMLGQRRLDTWTLAKPGLPKYELVTSSAPCAMCLGAVLWSGVASLVCGARTEDVQAVGFDEGPVFDESFEYVRQRGVLVVKDVLRDEARAVLHEYRARGGTIYNR